MKSNLIEYKSKPFLVIREIIFKCFIFAAVGVVISLIVLLIIEGLDSHVADQIKTPLILCIVFVSMLIGGVWAISHRVKVVLTPDTIIFMRGNKTLNSISLKGKQLRFKETVNTINNVIPVHALRVIYIDDIPYYCYNFSAESFVDLVGQVKLFAGSGNPDFMQSSQQTDIDYANIGSQPQTNILGTVPFHIPHDNLIAAEKRRMLSVVIYTSIVMTAMLLLWYFGIAKPSGNAIEGYVYIILFVILYLPVIIVGISQGVRVAIYKKKLPEKIEVGKTAITIDSITINANDIRSITMTHPHSQRQSNFSTHRKLTITANGHMYDFIIGDRYNKKLIYDNYDVLCSAVETFAETAKIALVFV